MSCGVCQRFPVFSLINLCLTLGCLILILWGPLFCTSTSLTYCESSCSVARWGGLARSYGGFIWVQILIIIWPIFCSIASFASNYSLRNDMDRKCENKAILMGANAVYAFSYFICAALEYYLAFGYITEFCGYSYTLNFSQNYRYNNQGPSFRRRPYDGGNLYYNNNFEFSSTNSIVLGWVQAAGLYVWAFIFTVVDIVLYSKYL
uniref:MARVEL domain-containing protein n=1 Tax=Rhabditophanes sp. KR3021 TaxID=114890 RepID=A0AC35TZI7_9BILA